MGQRKTNYFILLLLSGLTGIFVAFVMLHDPMAATLQTYSPPARVTIGTTEVTVPSWSIFSTGNIWQLVSTKRAIGRDYAPTLIDTSVSHAPAASQIAKAINAPLNDLVAAARVQDVNLMLSSAYRSYTDQETLYNTLLSAKGREYVLAYVAIPGESEHQTGLAVDLASVTNGCLKSADACSLDATGIAWLHAHAPEFGFIERYPEGMQSITGIAGEHWHYRYVGVPLAKALTSANMTLDEFVAQTAPGL